MTETAEDTGTTGRTFRMFNDAWDLIGGKVKGTRSDHSTFVRDMTDAGLDCARCWRCRRLVPVEFRDLTGKPLAEWVAEAGKVVTAQHRTTQHRNGHHPVTIGRRRTGDTGAGLAALYAELDQARAALEPLQTRAARAEARAARAEGEAGALVRKLEKAEAYASELKAAMARESARRAAEAEGRSARSEARAARDRRNRQIIDAARAGQDRASIAERFGLAKSRVGQIVRDVGVDGASSQHPEAAPGSAAAVPQVPASRGGKGRQP